MGPTGPESSGAPIVAAALVNGVPLGDGYVSSTGFGPYTRTGPGQYSLQLLGTPPPDANCVVNVTIFSPIFTAPVNVSAGVLGGFVIVNLFNTGLAVFVDARFNVIVTDDR